MKRVAYVKASTLLIAPPCIYWGRNDGNSYVLKNSWHYCTTRDSRKEMMVGKWHFDNALEYDRLGVSAFFGTRLANTSKSSHPVGNKFVSMSSDCHETISLSSLFVPPEMFLNFTISLISRSLSLLTKWLILDVLRL